ncbi:hypothetical protein ABIE86_008874 [Bradyrhizobium diazoefficiens]
MDGNLVQSMADPHFPGHDRPRHALANKAPWHGVAVRVDLDGAIIADDVGQFTQGSERRLSAERFQPMYLITRKADDRGASPVAPWMRTFATSRSHLSRCASNASQLGKE